MNYIVCFRVNSFIQKWFTYFIDLICTKIEAVLHDARKHVGSEDKYRKDTLIGWSEKI